MATIQRSEEQADDLAQKIEARLETDALFERVRDDHELDVRQYCNFDLASLVELRLGAHVEPSVLNGTLRDDWIKRAIDEGESVDLPFSLDRRCYWIRTRTGERVGSIAFRVEPYTMRPTVAVSSIFVHPAHRKQGLGRRSLLAMRDAAYAEGIQNVTLYTQWIWPRAVRFYLNTGMWLRSWKHDLHFMFARDLPRWRVDFSENEARFLIETRGTWRALIEAEKQGERLVWTETATFKRRRSLRCEVPTTFVLALATRGWPLKRDDNWQRYWGSDAVHPEAFARRIQGFESWARINGWVVETPRIAGLEYPSWHALNRSRR